MSGDVRFKLPGGSSCQSGLCDRNLNLLAHAQMIELEIGSECGGHGICGKDRVKLSEASRDLVSPVSDEERAHLSPSELAAGWRLGCQCFPESSGASIEVEVIREPAP